MKMVPDNIPSVEFGVLSRDRLAALAFAAITVLLGSFLIVDGVSGAYHDDGIYITVAKAMAQGDGYRLVHLPDAPVQTKYPFLYPAILAVIWKIFPSFPGNLLFMQWVSLLSGAFAAGLSYLYLICFGYCSRGVAAGAVALCVTLPSFLFFCTSCLSEMPFALLLVATMWMLDRHIRTPFPSRIAQLLLGTLAALPLLCRIIGLVSIIALIFLAFRHRKILRWPAAGASLICILFFGWVLTYTKWSDATVSSSYYTNYLTWWHSFGIPHWGRVLISNAYDAFQGSSPLSMLCQPEFPAWIERIAALIGCAGLLIILRQAGQRRVLPVLLAAYLGTVCIWPWPPFRFLAPIQLYLFAYSILATMAVCKIRTPVLRHAGTAVLAILILFNVGSVYQDILESRANRYPAYMLNYGSPAVHWSDYEEMFLWIRARSSPGDLFICAADPMLYLYTGRRSFRPYVSRPGSMFYDDPAPAYGTLGEVLANIRSYRPQYLVLAPTPGFSEEISYSQFLTESQRKYPGWLECVYQGKDKRFAIWKIQRMPQPSLHDAALLRGPH